LRRPPEGDATSCIIERAQSEVGGLGWRERLISHAPQLGRTGGVSLLPPVYASRSPAPLTRGRRWRAAPNRGFRLPARSAAPRASTPSGGEESEARGLSAGDGAACPCGSSTKIRMQHDSHPTKPPYGRHGGAYKGRWSTTTPTDGVEGGDRGGGEGRSRGACGQSVTGVRSGGRTPGRVAERWPSEAETPERRAHTPRAASPGGYEAAPRRQRRRRGGEEREAIWRRGGTEPRSVRAVSNRGSERREDAGTRSGAVAERGGDPGEESPHTMRGESRRVRGRAEAAAQEERGDGGGGSACGWLRGCENEEMWIYPYRSRF